MTTAASARSGTRDSLLRYVATLQHDRAFAGLRGIPERHPLALEGGDNIVAIASDRYTAAPLVIAVGRRRDV